MWFLLFNCFFQQRPIVFCESDGRLWHHLHGQASRYLSQNALIELKTVIKQNPPTADTMRLAVDGDA